MLLLATKTIAIGDHPVKLYSLDGGKLWFSCPKDLRQFKLRKHEDKESLRFMFRKHVGSTSEPLLPDGRPNIRRPFWRPASRLPP